MAFRVFLLILLVVSMAAIPTGEAQLGGLLGGGGGGLGGLLGGGGGVGGLLGTIGGLLGLINIQGTLFCTLNGATNGTSTSVFPNALVQLQCGNGNVVASTNTNQAGLFGFVLDPLKFLTSSLLSNCNIVVATPLSTCNVSLPSVGNLTSPLQLAGNTVSGVLRLLNITPSGFSLTTTVNT